MCLVRERERVLDAFQRINNYNKMQIYRERMVSSGEKKEVQGGEVVSGQST